MEDVIVERTTMRSTTQNPRPKPNSALINGDNINVGTIIVNSPNANVNNAHKSCGCKNNNSYEKSNDSDRDAKLFGTYLMMTLIAVGIK
jgi:hypothetical protein